ncbi:MAG TPA: CheR family methyltransferase [Bryobacteraceae bacterium]|nr:CheR family methyltransferase [Bryobacteraceae bacterium]
MSDRLELGVPAIRPKEFALIRDFALSTFGLDLHQGKERLVSARLGKHLLAGGFKSFEDYFRHVEKDKTGASIIALINSLPTNHTAFLREADHFQYLIGTVLPEYRSRGQVRVWSAACSTGEEVYSLLFSYLDAQSGNRLPQLKVTGTDISTRVLGVARTATYPTDRVAQLPQAWITRFLRKVPPDRYEVRDEIRNMADFHRLNLMEPFPESYRFPVIFCRNVMIYFNKATQSQLVRRLGERLEPGGYLFVGHAESLSGLEHGLRYIKPAVYRKAV